MKRIEYIDHWKGVGILLVLLTHTLGYTRGLDATNILSWQVEAWLHSFIMPYFVFINGYTFYEFYFKTPNKTTANLKNYLRSLFHIYLLFGSAMILVKWQLARYTVAKISFSDMILNFFLPNTTMWYIWFLIVVTTLITLLLKIKISQRIFQYLYITFFILSVLFGGPLHLSSFPLAIQHLTSLPLFYILGIMTSKYRSFQSSKKKPILFYSCCRIILFYAFMICQLQSYPQTNLIWHTLLRYLNAYAMIFILIYSLHRFSVLCRFLSWFGRHSLYLYLIHTYILAIFIILARRYLITIPNGLLIIIAFITCLILSSCLSIWITKAPVLNRIVKGQWFQ